MAVEPTLEPVQPDEVTGMAALFRANASTRAMVLKAALFLRLHSNHLLRLPLDSGHQLLAWEWNLSPPWRPAEMSPGPAECGLGYRLGDWVVSQCGRGLQWGGLGGLKKETPPASHFVHRTILTQFLSCSFPFHDSLIF